MLRTTLAGLRAHKLRLLLTSVAITLGVGFIAGTFVLTDTIRAGFSQQVTAEADKLGVAVTPKGPGAVLPAGTLEKVRGVAGVAEAQGLVRGKAPLLGKDGKVVGDYTPTLAISVVQGRLNRTTIISGTGPGSDDQAAVLDKNTAKDQGFTVGQTITVLDSREREHRFKLVGIMDTGLDQELAFNGAVGLTTAMAQRLTGAKGYAEIDVAGDPSLKPAVAAVVGGGAEVRTGAELA
uniref:ABC transporter permease n=1 Tax=Nonomuraea rhizosphaerae TaxID=2665663 RepID=UPI001C5E5947